MLFENSSENASLLHYLNKKARFTKMLGKAPKEKDNVAAQIQIQKKYI